MATDVLYLIMLNIDRNVDKKFQPSIFYRGWVNLLYKVRAAKKAFKSSQTAMDVYYLIMLNIDGNVNKKFQTSNFYRSRYNQLWKIKAAK